MPVAGGCGAWQLDAGATSASYGALLWKGTKSKLEGLSGALGGGMQVSRRRRRDGEWVGLVVGGGKDGGGGFQLLTTCSRHTRFGDSSYDPPPHPPHPRTPSSWYPQLVWLSSRWGPAPHDTWPFLLPLLPPLCLCPRSWWLCNRWGPAPRYLTLPSSHPPPPHPQLCSEGIGIVLLYVPQLSKQYLSN